mmetsp:Transcript_5147/g.17169  ORF Transcript_5147/g.17169 Transcript_5147/m.17169 type:complete len:272 (-) Transcript_5147:1359-2174(-)
MAHTKRHRNIYERRELINIPLDRVRFLEILFAPKHAAAFLRRRRRGDAVADPRDDQEHSRGVHKGERLAVLGVRGHSSQEAARVEWDVPHGRHGVPQQNPKQVEEQVAQGDLHGFARVGRRDGGAHDSGERGADVRAEGKGEHLLQGDQPDRRDWRERSGGDGRGLDHDGDAHTNQHVEVRVEPDDLFQNARGAAFDDDLQGVHDAEQTCAQTAQGPDREERPGAGVGHFPFGKSDAALEKALVAQPVFHLGAHCVRGARRQHPVGQNHGA